ncbi:pyridoxal phosphate-dependent aminotransferase [Psychrosphaera sp. B3R10]|uniref:pyridoxal phosphate-dependent aminotransferase n=1 Tax=unclassified Psychrosphaera TaxID=2641570 RepID=UPI001C0A5191|nr:MULTISPECIES: pyridoxal phosphate-dependent aminotransferase [unclassified Psychrosphaera]MBU2882367.1 pyridoxal phosphate-dependent aminotransferase [Psychrosphaera sp. I2R16]MBU2989048.1 pyridoxal phosphate-dependent aminotransferase [Psychrosphaera sp. B3R10]MDO6718044.1 pyridoxal phosphate-dependent aminotransferase [Psychrosphaera sp. 1_MG-2023]
MKTIKKSSKLDNVCYDIRGPVLDEAKRLEEAGHKILKLNVGNPAPFGFQAPDDILKDVIAQLPKAQGYSDSKGLYSARVAIMQYYQQKGLRDVTVNDIYIGNGVSELISMSMQALLDNGDEVLVPSPDYPLWTATVSVSGGKAVHYLCDENDDWAPSIEDIKSKITKKTRAIVLINPNNPTGAVYSKKVLLEIADLAAEHDLIIFSDEIYDKVLYDDAVHHSIAAMRQDLFIVTFSGLSKNYRVAGFRTGWMLLSGPKKWAGDYIDGLNMLASMRLCANVPCQNAIQQALGGYQSINDLVAKEGRLYRQMDYAYKALNAIDGISVTRPKGAMYLFPKIDLSKFNIEDDEKMVLDLLRQKYILVVHGRGFNWPSPDHFRLVFLPHIDELKKAISDLSDFLDVYRK